MFLSSPFVCLFAGTLEYMNIVGEFSWIFLEVVDHDIDEIFGWSKAHNLFIL